MSPTKSKRTVSAGDLRIDLTRRTVARGNRRLAIEPKVFDVIAVLAGAKGRVVTTDELLARVWPQIHVTASSLTRAISLARSALRNEHDGQSYIQTVPARGYRFVAPPGVVLDGFTTLVGRAAELTVIETGLETIRAGARCHVWISGEAGIGKTALLAHTIRSARTRGAQVLHARCREGEGAAAFAPWIQLLSGSDAGAALLDPGEPASSGAGARLRQFHRVAAALTRYLGDGPLVLVLDDLHRADVPSLRLLQWIIAHVGDGPLMIAGAFRTVALHLGKERARILGELMREPGSWHLPLAAFDAAEVRQLAVELGYYDLPAASIAHISDRTGGNPFFVTHLLAAEALGQKTTDPAPLTLPSDLRLTILEQVHDLPASCRTILDIAAVLGRDFDLATLATTAGRTEAETLAALEPALKLRVLVSHLDSASVGFVHAIVRDALYDDLGALEAAKLHAQVIANCPADRHDARAAELAMHAARAVSVLGDETAVAFTVRAARHASRRLAHEEAASQYGRALALLEHSTTPDHARRCDLLLAMGEAHLRAGDRAAATGAFRQAADVAASIGASATIARAALSIAPGFLAVEHAGYDPLLVDLLDRALAARPLVDDPMRAQLLSRRALALYWTASDEERARTIDQTAHLVVGADRELRDGVAASNLLATWGPDNFALRLRDLPGLLTAAESVGDRARACFYRMLWITTSLEAGDIATVREHVLRFEAEARALREPQAEWTAELFRAMLALQDGRFAAAVAHAERFHAVGQRAGDSNATLSYHAVRTCALLFADRGPELIDEMRAICDAFPNVLNLRSAFVWALAQAGRRDEVERHLETLRPELPGLAKNVAWPTTMVCLSEGVATAGLPRHADVLLDALRPFADRCAVVGFGTASLGSVAYYLGRLAATCGRRRDARSWLRQGLEENRRCAAAPFVARAERALHALGGS